MLNASPMARAACGFSLIELLVATTLGLIVSGAAVALIVSVDQSNSETIQSTRLTQELRSLAIVISDDLKRANSLDDPIGMVGQGTTSCPTQTTKTPAQPCYAQLPNATRTSTTCAIYGYTGYTTANPADSTYGTERRTYIYHDVRRSTDGSGVGSVVLDELTFDPGTTAQTMPWVAAPASGCTMSDANSVATALNPSPVLSSSQVDITALAFTWISVSEIDLSITGKFKAGDTYSKNISRTFTQPIFIRSGTP